MSSYTCEYAIEYTHTHEYACIYAYKHEYACICAYTHEYECMHVCIRIQLNDMNSQPHEFNGANKKVKLEMSTTLQI
jgi:hypothetical protein